MSKVKYKEALVRGTFSPSQAKEIISALFSSKIEMHSKSSFSKFIRTGSESKEDNSRRKELIESLKKLGELLDEKMDDKVRVKLNCPLELSFVKVSSKNS